MSGLCVLARRRAWVPEGWSGEKSGLVSLVTFSASEHARKKPGAGLKTREETGGQNDLHARKATETPREGEETGGRGSGKGGRGSTKRERERASRSRERVGARESERGGRKIQGAEGDPARTVGRQGKTGPEERSKTVRQPGSEGNEARTDPRKQDVRISPSPMPAWSPPNPGTGALPLDHITCQAGRGEKGGTKNGSPPSLLSPQRRAHTQSLENWESSQRERKKRKRKHACQPGKKSEKRRTALTGREKKRDRAPLPASRLCAGPARALSLTAVACACEGQARAASMRRCGVFHTATREEVSTHGRVGSALHVERSCHFSAPYLRHGARNGKDTEPRRVETKATHTHPHMGGRGDIHDKKLRRRISHRDIPHLTCPRLVYELRVCKNPRGT